MAVKPWQGWYHCIGSTYGTWLRGDGRGFRTRHHREHVEGDYRQPPPAGKYRDELIRSRQSMVGGEVRLPADLRPVVCRVLANSLLFYEVELAEMSVGAMHWHALARFMRCNVKPPRTQRKRGTAHSVDPIPRTVLGRARSYTTHELKSMGRLGDHDGGLWAKRPKVLPVEDERHFEYLRWKYIPAHAEEGAAIYTQLPGE